jgi:UDP-GlcNAc:undecaprenyl-phosphate/decaprenyl-phosphate GlcNAc-1-phosphate transferase
MPFFVAIALALVLTWVARRVGLATGLVDRPAEHDAAAAGQEQLKIHAVPIPVLGGLGVMAATLATLAVVGQELPLLVIAGVVVATGIGLLDDARPQPASVRIVALAVAGVLLAVGLPLDPVGSLSRAGMVLLLARAGVVVLLLLLANAVNLIDGQDGLAGGLGAIASVGLAVVIAANGEDPVLAVVLAGALVGFLAWNLPPARIFLGNGGAYGLGSLLTVLAAQATTLHGYHGLLAAGLCLGVFAFELTFTVVRRVVASQGLATGDRRHSYDLLGRSRGNRDRSTLALWTLGAVSAGAGYAADQVSLAAAGTMIAVAVVMGAGAGSRLWRQAMTVEPDAAPQPRERG